MGTRRLRAAVALAGALAVTATSAGCFAEPSALPTVRDFLVAWQAGHYADAAKQTDGDRKAVAAALRALPSQLDLASLHLSLGPLRQNGDDAVSQFEVRIDLGDNGPPWDYRGQMHLRRRNGEWKVVWSPSIIHPQLGPGQRLAVVTVTPKRASILDSRGKSLTRSTRAEIFGVVPGQLADPQKTLGELSKITNLDKDRVIGHVLSAPPQEFLPLVTLQVPDQAAQAARLAQVAGVQSRTKNLPLAPAAAADVVGRLGPATAELLQQAGAPYQPGDTVGVSGLQALDQRMLAGTPTVEVVAQDPSGAHTKELYEAPGTPSQSVHTTIDRTVQNAAEHALGHLRAPASLAAVDQTTGEILALANNAAQHGTDAALDGHYPPGMTFSIVTTRALLQYDHKLSAPVACPPTLNVGGQVFHGTTSRSKTFQSNFAVSCPTAFASLYRNLSYQDLRTSAAHFGIGAPWTLPLPSFSGSVPVPVNDAERAASMVGQGRVQVSPISMALAAAAVGSGTWRPPRLLKDSTPSVPPQSLDPTTDSVTTLQSLMQRAVQHGSARAANLPGAVVRGVAATVPYGNGKTVSWFVGYRDNVAFALAVEGKVSAAQVAATFLRGVHG